jgi:hypothetical protein
VGESDWMPFGPTRRVSDMAVENGPPRDVGAVDLSREDVLVGAIGWRWNGVGEDGGVSPDPEDGSSTGGEATLGGELAWAASGIKDVASADPTGAIDVEGLDDSRRSIRDMTILPSRMRSRIAIPYGE